MLYLLYVLRLCYYHKKLKVFDDEKKISNINELFYFLFSSLAVNAEEVLQEDSGKNVEVMDSMELQSEITPGYYQVTGTGVRFREEPGLSGSIIAVLTKGEYLLYERVAGPTGDADGYTWLRCERYSTGEIGYIAVNYITPADPPPGAP